MSERKNSSNRLRRLASHYEKSVSRARAEQLVARAMARVQGSRYRRPRAAILGGISAAVLLVIVLGATSSSSLPGDALYGVGRAYEAVGEFAGLVDPVEERLNEVIALAERGDVVRAAEAAEEALSGLGRPVDDLILPLVTTTTSTSTTVPADTGGEETDESSPPTTLPAVTVEADAEPDEDPIDSLKVAAELLLSTVRGDGIEEDGADLDAAAAELAEAISVLETEETEETVDTTSTTTTIPEETTSTSTTTTSTTPEETSSTTTTIPEETTTTVAEEAEEEGPGPIILPPEF